MVLRDIRNFSAGIMYLLIGGAAIFLARGYGIGTAANMGSGYFPVAIGCLLSIIGIYLIVRAFLVSPEDDGSAPETWSLKIILIIVAAIAAFALLAPSLGFVVAVAALIAIAGLASGERSWKEMAVMVVGLTTVSVIIFIFGLGLTFMVWPPFLSN